MDCSKNINNSLCILILVFLVVLIFNYLYQKLQNRDNSEWIFDWKKNSLIALAFASFSALVSSLFLMKKSEKNNSLLSPSNISLKELGLEMKQRMDGGCSPCKALKHGLRKPRVLNLKSSPIRKYKMHCSEM
jgi:hypothetical protein